MTAQASLFGGASYAAARPEVCGKARKKQGMAKAAAHHAKGLEVAQRLARHLGNFSANHDGITIELVRSAYERGFGPWDLANAAGMVFDPKLWECVGRVKAQRPEAHHREIKVWRLRR